MTGAPPVSVLAVVSLSGEAALGTLGRSGFSSIVHLRLPEEHSADGIPARRAAVEAAEKAGAEWLMLLAPGQSLAADALELMHPALGLYDAIFGAAHLEGSGEAVARLSRLAFDTAERLPHALLAWWLPASHLVRTEAAASVLDSLGTGERRYWQLDYLFEIWTRYRCMKSAQPLLEILREPEPLGGGERDEVLRRLDAEPVFLPIVHGEAVYHLPYTGRNAGIEREQSRGLFFEAMELEELRRQVRPGARMVDVGANTGNHTVFFAGPMRAASVTPFEPLPEAGRALRAAVDRNRLGNVDLSYLGIGVADRSGRARLVSSARGGLGATSLVPDQSGEIDVAPLDLLLSAPVDFLKVDVEGMEMSVLEGADATIAKWKPLIFIEIANRNTAAFSAWLDTAGYRVDRVFTDKGHANYLVSPRAAA